MDINNRRHLHAVARARLENAPQAAKIALVYGGCVVGASLLGTGISYLLTYMTNQFGGLANLGIRSMLSTISTIIPFLVNFLVMALELGFLNAMLRVSRQQYASPQSLKMGFQRFWPLLKVTLLESCLYLAAAIASMYLASILFSLTPLSWKLSSLLDQAGGLSSAEAATALMNDSVLLGQMSKALTPMFILMLVIMVGLSIPIAYFYRMTSYVIVDKPGIPALIAMHVSRNMMRHNFKKMFRLDLSMWWYYASMILAGLACFGDLLLGLAGVELSMSPTAASLLFQAIYLIGSFAILVFLKPHLSVAYALAYDSIRPQEKPPEGAVLGNIFDMQ